MQVDQIIEGTWKNLLNKDGELYESRIAICRKCKLFIREKFFGEVCNSSLYLNTVTNEVTEIQRKGFVQGCGCVLSSKTRVKEAHCPAGKW